MKNDNVYLHHIIECITRIERNVSTGKNQFITSDTLQDAVLRNLQTLAESTQRLSDNLKEQHPEIEWLRIAAFRTFLSMITLVLI